MDGSEGVDGSEGGMGVRGCGTSTLQFDYCSATENHLQTLHQLSLLVCSHLKLGESPERAKQQKHAMHTS